MRGWIVTIGSIRKARPGFAGTQPSSWDGNGNGDSTGNVIATGNRNGNGVERQQLTGRA
jgi:hypothetical protein